MSKPLFSFLLITYNQEKYVKDAFDACINQTYRDYEIIICDDCSSDNTFSVLNNLVDKYREKGGQIHIVLHKNDSNKGIGGNFQQAAELSHGEWLVMAAGDDISLPTRLENLSKIISDHPNAFGINTARFFVDENACNPQYNFKKDYLLGADSAWHHSLFTDFIPLDKRVMSEDHILNLRAMLKGDIIQVNIPTILYRISSGNYSLQKASNIIERKKNELKKMRYHLNLLLFRLSDLDFWAKYHQEPLQLLIRRKIEKEIDEIEKRIQSFELFLKVAQSSVWDKIKYIFTPSKIWLHTLFIYRIYNILKMCEFVKELPKRSVEQAKINTVQDGAIEVISISDFVDDSRNIF